MYNKEILKGIIIGKAKLHFSIYKSNRYAIGYHVTCEIFIRGGVAFLGNLDRTLAQHQIDFRYEVKGHSHPPTAYVLVIGKKKALRKLVALVKDLPVTKDLELLKEITEIQDSNLSKLDKFEAICKLKGVL